MNSTLRVLGLAVSLVGAMFASMAVAFGMRERLPAPPLRAITAAEAAVAFDVERAAAAQLGMTLAEEGEAPVTTVNGLGVWRRPVALGAQECVAVIVSVRGYQAPRAVALQHPAADSSRITRHPTRPLSVHQGNEGLAAQAQWCNWEPGSAVAVAETRSLDPDLASPFRDGVLRYAVYRGPWARVGGPAALTRGELSARGLADLGPEPAVLAGAALMAGNARSLGAPIDITLAGARLVPANATTYRRLYEAVRGRLEEPVNPRVDPFVPAGDRWGLGLPVNAREVIAGVLRGADAPPLHDPVIEVGRNRFRRVIAVVDRGRLGASCVRLTFTRLVVGHGARVYRYDEGDSDVGSALATQGNVATDVSCPATGVTTYAVDDTDQETYRLNVWATGQ